MTVTASRKDPGTKPPAPAARRRGLTSRPVVFGAVVVSTFITVADGIRPPGHGPYLFLGGVVVWLVTCAALVILFTARGSLRCAISRTRSLRSTPNCSSM